MHSFIQMKPCYKKSQVTSGDKFAFFLDMSSVCAVAVKCDSRRYEITSPHHYVTRAPPPAIARIFRQSKRARGRVYASLN